MRIDKPASHLEQALRDARSFRRSEVTSRLASLTWIDQT